MESDLLAAIKALLESSQAMTGGSSFTAEDMVSYQKAVDWAKGDIFYLSFSSLTKLDHFPDVRKMIRDVMPCGLAGYLGFVDYLGEVFPFGVTQEPLQVTGKPELLAVNLLGVVLEVLMQLYDDVAFHGMTSFVDD